MEGQKEGVDYVVTPYAIDDPELGRIVYGANDRVPMADAVKYGLVAAPKKRTSPRTTKKAPAEDRSRKSAGNR